MIRPPELEQALADLRPVYSELQKVERDLKKEDVKANLGIWATVDRRCRDLRSDIGTRADRIVGTNVERATSKFRVMMALLGTDAKVRKRVGRRPNAAQITAALRRSVTDYEMMVAEHDAKAAAAAKIAADTRERLNAHRGACILFTGYPS